LSKLKMPEKIGHFFWTFKKNDYFCPLL